MQRTARSPQQGQPRDDLSDGLRCAREGRHVIFYRADEATVITVVRVLRERMDIPEQLAE